MPHDPLVSIAEIARQWMVQPIVVADLVADGDLPSLDGGRLARSGDFDVPCLRASWAEQYRVSSPVGARRIDLEGSTELHPAAAVASALYTALSDRDWDSAWLVSSVASREAAGSPEALTERWRAALGDAFGDDVCLTTGVYRLTPHAGVGVRLVTGSLPTTVVIERPTPLKWVALIPLVEEHGDWLADLPTAELPIDWPALLRTAPN